MNDLQALCGRLDFKYLHIERKLLFLSKMLRLKMTLFRCFNCFNSSSECCALHYDYDINVDRCSAVAIKEKVRYGFRNCCCSNVLDLVLLHFFLFFDCIVCFCMSCSLFTAFVANKLHHK